MSIFENTVMVNKRPSYWQVFFRYLFIVLAALCAFGTLFLSPLLFVTPTVLFLCFAYLLHNASDVEYEYTYIEGELDIDKIKAKRKRKKVAKIDLDELILIAPHGSDELNQYSRSSDCKRINATSRKQGKKIYDVVYHHDSTTELVSFEPNEKMLETIRTRHPRKVII